MSGAQPQDLQTMSYTKTADPARAANRQRQLFQQVEPEFPQLPDNSLWADLVSKDQTQNRGGRKCRELPDVPWQGSFEDCAAKIVVRARGHEEWVWIANEARVKVSAARRQYGLNAVELDLANVLINLIATYGQHKGYYGESTRQRLTSFRRDENGVVVKDRFDQPVPADPSGFYMDRSSFKRAEKTLVRVGILVVSDGRWRSSGRRYTSPLFLESESGLKGVRRTCEKGVQSTALWGSINQTKGFRKPGIPSGFKDSRIQEVPPNPQGGRDLDVLFEKFWKVFPGSPPPKGRKTDKAKACEVFKRIATGKHRKGLKCDPEVMIAAAETYASTKLDPDFIPQPTTWLNGGRWEDHASKPAVADDDRADWWNMPDKVAKITRSQWIGSIQKYANGIWPIEKLGPPPGHALCVVPPEIIVELGLADKYDLKTRRAKDGWQGFGGGH